MPIQPSFLARIQVLDSLPHFWRLLEKVGLLMLLTDETAPVLGTKDDTD